MTPLTRPVRSEKDRKAEAFFSQLLESFPARDDVVSVVCQHAVPNSLAFVAAVDRKMPVVAFLSKSSSKQPDTTRALTERHRMVEIPSTPWTAADLHALLEEWVPPGKKVVLFDIGGHLAALAAQPLPTSLAGRVLGIVEDTRNGERDYQALPALHLPVYSAAQCPIKEIEDARVGPGAAQGAEFVLRKQLDSSLHGMRTIGVIGYGKVGRGLAHYLKNAGHRVLVCDEDLMQGYDAAIDKFRIVDLLDLTRESDLVFSATGNAALRSGHLKRLPPGAAISCLTSADKEAGFLVPRTEEVLVHTRRKDDAVFILNGGRPLNFLLGGINDAAIYGVQGEMLLAAAALCRPPASKPTLFSLSVLSPAERRALSAAWIAHYAAPNPSVPAPAPAPGDGLALDQLVSPPSIPWNDDFASGSLLKLLAASAPNIDPSMVGIVDLDLRLPTSIAIAQALAQRMRVVIAVPPQRQPLPDGLQGCEAHAVARDAVLGQTFLKRILGPKERAVVLTDRSELSGGSFSSYQRRALAGVVVVPEHGQVTALDLAHEVPVHKVAPAPRPAVPCEDEFLDARITRVTRGKRSAQRAFETALPYHHRILKHLEDLLDAHDSPIALVGYQGFGKSLARWGDLKTRNVTVYDDDAWRRMEALQQDLFSASPGQPLPNAGLIIEAMPVRDGDTDRQPYYGSGRVYRADRPSLSFEVAPQDPTIPWVQGGQALQFALGLASRTSIKAHARALLIAALSHLPTPHPQNMCVAILGDSAVSHALAEVAKGTEVATFDSVVKYDTGLHAPSTSLASALPKAHLVFVESHVPLAQHHIKNLRAGACVVPLPGSTHQLPFPMPQTQKLAILRPDGSRVQLVTPTLTAAQSSDDWEEGLLSPQTMYDLERPEATCRWESLCDAGTADTQKLTQMQSQLREGRPRRQAASIGWEEGWDTETLLGESPWLAKQPSDARTGLDALQRSTIELYPSVVSSAPIRRRQESPNERARSLAKSFYSLVMEDVPNPLRQSTGFLAVAAPHPTQAAWVEAMSHLGSVDGIVALPGHPHPPTHLDVAPILPMVPAQMHDGDFAAEQLRLVVKPDRSYYLFDSGAHWLPLLHNLEATPLAGRVLGVIEDTPQGAEAYRSALESGQIDLPVLSLATTQARSHANKQLGRDMVDRTVQLLNEADEDLHRATAIGVVGLDETGLEIVQRLRAYPDLRIATEDPTEVLRARRENLQLSSIEEALAAQIVFVPRPTNLPSSVLENMQGELGMALGVPLSEAFIGTAAVEEGQEDAPRAPLRHSGTYALGGGKPLSLVHATWGSADYHLLGAAKISAVSQLEQMPSNGLFTLNRTHEQSLAGKHLFMFRPRALDIYSDQIPIVETVSQTSLAGNLLEFERHLVAFERLNAGQDDSMESLNVSAEQLLLKQFLYTSRTGRAVMTRPHEFSQQAISFFATLAYGQEPTIASLLGHPWLRSEVGKMQSSQRAFPRWDFSDMLDDLEVPIDRRYGFVNRAWQPQFGLMLLAMQIAEQGEEARGRDEAAHLRNLSRRHAARRDTLSRASARRPGPTRLDRRGGRR